VEVKEIKGVKINKFDSKGVEITATLHVVNPNNYKVQVTKTDADIFLDGKRAGKAVLLKKIEVPGNSDGDFDANIRADFDNGSLSMLPMLINAAVKKKIDIRATGSISAKSFLIGKKFDFDETHKAQF
jgi:LEA14-like dessication related protein